MIWLRLLIAVIALTISSDLSAWAQPQMQVNSPEGFYDCKGFANGPNTRDREGGCCLPSQQTEAPCFRCKPPNFCESLLNQCGTTATRDKNDNCCDMTKCETELNLCGATADVDCGCGKPAKVPRPTVGCPTTRCRPKPTAGNEGWPMEHSHSSACPSNRPVDARHVDFNHQQTFFHVTLSADYNTQGSVPCSGGRTEPALCSNQGKSGWIYATDPAKELITDAEAQSASSRICCNGVIQTGNTCPAPLMYCPPQ